MEPGRPRPQHRIRLNQPVVWIGAALGILVLALAALAFAAGFADRNSIHLYGMNNARPVRVAAVYFSGDMGLRFGMGRHVAPALAARGIPVFGVSSPAVFNTQRSRGDVNALVAETIRRALVRSGADQVILMGQSFGSDILVAGLEALPPDLHRKVAAVVLVVPGQTVYFRADPTGLRYHGTPDADAVSDIGAMTWAPLICIYGQSENDSLCPTLLGKAAKVIELPGDHFLRNDHAKLIETIFTALAPILRQNPIRTAPFPPTSLNRPLLN
ncbi:MAG: AcvB/VirJ family lysyl-phosphatidylglycerol hydrolase [Novosphingobium sp.]